MRALLVAAALAAASFLPVSGFAGTTGQLAGTVTDAGSRAPISGASVTVSSPAQREATTSDATGHFSFVSLAPGVYVVTVSREGYATQTYSNVAVNADASTAIALLTFRPLRQIGSVLDYHYPSIFQDHVTSDVYVVTPVTPFYSFDGHDIYALHFIPGLTFGDAPALSR
jgi:Carboxypeptidase regulatory-like domain